MKPIFLQDIQYLGKPYWVEFEGYGVLVHETSGSFAFVASKIMGWNCKTIGETWGKQKEVNFAPRVRYWEDKPNKEDRENGEWSDESRAWAPAMPYYITKNERDAMYEKYLKTGQTQFE